MISHKAANWRICKLVAFCAATPVQYFGQFLGSTSWQAESLFAEGDTHELYHLL
jgi:hypothetical protein